MRSLQEAGEELLTFYGYPPKPVEGRADQERDGAAVP